MKFIFAPLFFVLLLSIQPLGAAGIDCEPLGHLPNYTSDANNDRKGAPEIFTYASFDFPLADADPVTIKGRRCSQNFNKKEGTDDISPLEIILNYKDQMGKLGATILLEEKTRISAKLLKDGNEMWMYVSCDGGAADSYTVVVLNKTPLKPTLTKPGETDYRLFGHMPGLTLKATDKKNFDEFEFPLTDSDPVKVQGKCFHFNYGAGTAPIPSDLEIIENYADAIRSQGGEVLLESNTDLTARMENGGQQIWIKVHSVFDDLSVDIVEEKPFQASIEPPKADALKAALDKEGHIALSVNFDFAKAVLKPDAAPVIAQVVTLMKNNPDLKLSIEGHTDNVGGAEANQKLSESRAAAVVEAIVKGGIAADRLTSAGFGATKPIADNNSSEGRAKNRRVELVKKQAPLSS